MSSDIRCVLLAAGQSRRFGGNKLLHPLANGRPLLRQTVTNYLTVFESVKVVVPADSPMLRDCLGGLAVDFITATDPVKQAGGNRHLQGMSQSLITGVKANQGADGWLIALADMPYVESATIAKIAGALRSDNIVLPEYQSKDGHPVGFGAQFYPQLLKLIGDRGARPVIEANTERVLRLKVNDAGVLHDIDRPENILSV